MLCSSVYHTLMMKRGIKLIIIWGFLMIDFESFKAGRYSGFLIFYHKQSSYPMKHFLKKKCCTSYIQDSEKLNISIYQSYYEWLCECT